MRWRDIRFEKPTKADGDCHGEVAAVLFDGRKVSLKWNSTDVADMAHFWCPMSELSDPPARIPDPPEGWRFVEKGEAFDKRAMFWNETYSEWYVTHQLDKYDPELIYIVPIDPPAPQYRPFANAKEFEPFFGRMIKEKSLDDFRTVVTSFSDKGVWLAGGSVATGYREAFDIYEFANGIPFGVKVEPFEP